jgi:hypothetical protein
MAIVRRKISVKFQLQQGSFDDKKYDTVQLDGLRVQAIVTQGGSPSAGEASIRIFGAPLDVMNKLTILKNDLGGIPSKRANMVTLLAGDEGGALAPIFTGISADTFADFTDTPYASLIVNAQTGIIDQMRPVPPTSYSGVVDAATVIKGIAAQMGKRFQNHGVTASLENPYFPGTLDQQLKAAVAHVPCNMTDDAGLNAVIIWPIGKGRKDDAIVEVSREKGMIGYPAYMDSGIMLKTLYTPNINLGTIVKVTSDLAPVNGQWTVNSVEHNLESETPDGQWFTSFQANILGSTAPIVTRSAS